MSVRPTMTGGLDGILAGMDAESVLLRIAASPAVRVLWSNPAIPAEWTERRLPPACGRDGEVEARPEMLGGPQPQSGQDWTAAVGDVVLSAGPGPTETDRLAACLHAAILTEVISAEAPHGAVPMLAVVDRGPDSDADARFLMAAPACVRVAHLERAIRPGPEGGAADRRRLDIILAAAEREVGREALKQAVAALWPRWAEQLAHGFVHRVHAGPVLTRSVALDGRLIPSPFGLALPSWAAVELPPEAGVPGAELPDLLAALQSVAFTLEPRLGPGFLDGRAVEEIAALCGERFRDTVCMELLRLAGLDRVTARRLSTGPAAHRLPDIARRLFSHHRRERLDLEHDWAEPRIAWDLPHVWAIDPPRHLRDLRAFLDAELPDGDRAMLAARSAAQCRPRPTLHPMATRRAVAALIAEAGAVDRLDAGRIQALVVDAVAAARRDAAT